MVDPDSEVLTLVDLVVLGYKLSRELELNSRGRQTRKRRLPGSESCVVLKVEV